jgi:hypothetical protein
VAWEEEGKGKGREPSSAADKGHPGMGSGDDPRLRALRRECGHHTATGSVASDVGAVADKWAADKWARPSKIFSNFQTPLKHANSKSKHFLAPKIFKLCMM